MPLQMMHHFNVGRMWCTCFNHRIMFADDAEDVNGGKNMPSVIHALDVFWCVPSVFVWFSVSAQRVRLSRIVSLSWWLAHTQTLMHTTHTTHTQHPFPKYASTHAFGTCAACARFLCVYICPAFFPHPSLQGGRRTFERSLLGILPKRCGP